MRTVAPSTPLAVPVFTPQTLVDERAGNTKYIENVAYDLKSRERCSFVTMLKALMLRQVMMKDGNSRKDFTATAEEWEAVDQKFKAYLDDAVGFVNGPYGKPMRRELKAYCETATEKPRYPHFVNTLNEMLLYFRKLKSRSDAIEDGDIIFAINDPSLVESHHLPITAKRKPDLICLLAQKFRHLFHNRGHSGFKTCMKTAAKLKRDKKLQPQADVKTTWGDILQSWELEAKRQINSDIRTDFTVEEFLSGDEAEISAAAIAKFPAASTSQASVTNGVKRKRGSSYMPSSKKIKVDESSASTELRAPNDIQVQCAFYGIERLRHSMDITHSMTVLISDANLTLSWYDSQGCIEADRINIIEGLPLLAVMIRIFEDFPLGMWGYTPVEIWSEDKGQKKTPYRRKEKPVGSFQIIGRRTFTADATKVQPATQTATTPTTALNRRRSTRLSQRGAQPQPSTSGDERFSQDEEPEDEPTEDILFLKSAWSETRRCKEPEVILEAYKRAKNLLGTEARSVTDHLPVLVNSRELSYTSTEIIRRLVKSPTTHGFRVQLWMLSKKLQPIHALAPVDFWKAFWQTLRCHALLWRIGIAHGDVSLYNLMSKEDNKYGVLNDFDLSTIMKPGDQNPNRQGLERTGTLPFMALQLLGNKGFNGKVPRRYRHELECFAWVLVWVSRCVVDGEKCEPPWHLKRWLGHDNEDVMGSKLLFMRKQREIPMTSDYLWLESVVFRWIKSWDLLDQERLDSNPLRPPPEKTDSEHLQTFIAICTECAAANTTVSVPIDITWVDGLADLKFSIRGVPASPTSPLETAAAAEHPPLHSNGETHSDSGNSDYDMYVDDDGASFPNDTEFESTDGDDDRHSG
ncbi:hypothetical protein M413DRAFT_444376 [Hebeloma cylindrosporum]|uniref:Fungal-type protein kinase domain-containing protein n=1 Tax=Hebeloma cylindrosporum TaxID=76867 RepID=A0A0C3CET2_HEBCY|nr:hypothetical protein M413DRAFT_444376 [Hebeloma cylindrosporum h7]